MDREDRETAGTLYVIATPIGNIGDLSDRAREVLSLVDLLAAEDTRRTRGLLSRISVQTRTISYHDHNEAEVAEVLVEALRAGQSVGLVSDAGTPLVSDPGHTLLERAASANIRIVAVPGPSSVPAALSISALPNDRFCFEGFLPRASAARAKRLEALATESRTIVFFESVHRLGESLDALIGAFSGERRAELHRELTKLHEASYRGTLAELRAGLGESIPLLGEFVLVVAGRAQAEQPGEAEVRRVYELLAGAIDPKQAVALTAAITQVPRNAVYAMTRGRGGE